MVKDEIVIQIKRDQGRGRNTDKHDQGRNSNVDKCDQGRNSNTH